MEFRRASAADLRPLAEFWTHAFPGTRTVADRVRQLETGAPYGGLDSAWVAKEGGRITAAFRAYRMTQFLFGAALPMMGLAGVAVAVSARRRGIGRALCTEALRIARQRGDLVSILYPFRAGFYHPLGWGRVGELRSHRFHPEALGDLSGGEAVRLSDPSDLPAIADCYTRVASRSHGPLERGEGVWRTHLSQPGTTAWVLDASDGIAGYLLTRYGRRSVRELRVLHVRELIADNQKAYEALLAWVAAHRDQWRLVRYDARPSERFQHRLIDSRAPLSSAGRSLWDRSGTLLLGPMLRVVDVAAALARRPWHGPGLAFRLEVEDAELAENRGPWTVFCSEKGCEVEPAESSHPEAEIRTDAATFAQLWAAELLPGEAVRLGRARIQGSVERLEQAFGPRREFYLADEF